MKIFNWKNLSSLGILMLFVLGTVAVAQKAENRYESLARQFVDRGDAQLQQSQDAKARYNLLKYLAPAALTAGKLSEAKSYAEQLVEAAEQTGKPNSSKWRVGLATHISNTVLGLIAMDEGNLEAAKAFLLASGAVQGDPPTLLSFGPNMLLAKRLLEKGDRETVTKYLDLCENFWKKDGGRLDEWRKTIKQGGMPDFGKTTLNSIDGWRLAT